MVRIATTLVLAFSLASCGATPPAPSSDTASTDTVAPPDVPMTDQGGPRTVTSEEIKRAILGHVAEDVVLPTLTAFKEKADALAQATEAYANDVSPEKLVAAQQAWREAMTVWQRAEMMQLGPAGVMGEVLGGKDYRDEIYSWSTTNPCRVDQETLEEAYADAATLGTEPVNVRGLDAIEYLLFHPGDKNACKVNSGINKNGTWDAMKAEIPSRQAHYAASAAALVQAGAATLLAAWKVGEGDFATTLKAAGEGSSLFGTAQEGLNAISDALFYLDKMTKDMKLAEPVGVSGCDAETCPEALESRWAHYSKESVLANLEGFALMIYGGSDPAEALGFDDLLDSIGAKVLADELRAKIQAALQAVGGFEGTFAEALAEDPSRLESVYGSLKAITDLLKTQFMSVLDLEIPQRAASDND